MYPKLSWNFVVYALLLNAGASNWENAIFNLPSFSFVRRALEIQFEGLLPLSNKFEASKLLVSNFSLVSAIPRTGRWDLSVVAVK